MTATTELTLEDLTFTIQQEIQVAAPLDITFAALLEQLGPGNETHEGKSLSMKIEPWPGGRWFRDLGDDNGHFWGNVQAIKRPTLLEFSGPLALSNAVFSNVQYRLSETAAGTLITFRHKAFGAVSTELCEAMRGGWAAMNGRVRTFAEVKR